jgi:hypothetical protein
MYVEDNDEWLVPNNPANAFFEGGKRGPTWAWGDMRYGKPDGTNIDYLVGQREGSLGPYVKTHKIFKCPTDRSKTTLVDGQSYPRVRTYSMNSYMGTRATDNGGAVPFPTFLKRSEFSKVPNPELLVFADEHADSLSFSIFHLNRGRNIELWSHLPAARHSRSGVISYTDGHAEIHRWKDRRTVKPELGVFHGFDEATGNPDWKYLWERMTKAGSYWGDP